MDFGPSATCQEHGSSLICLQPPLLPPKEILTPGLIADTEPSVFKKCEVSASESSRASIYNAKLTYINRDDISIHVIFFGKNDPLSIKDFSEDTIQRI